MKVTKHYAIVKIRREKNTKISEHLVAAETYQDMKFNNQKGVLVQIGESTSKRFPAARIGDVAILHHAIEDEEWRLLDADDEFDFRLVVLTADEVYGVDRNGEIIPHPEHIWCIKEKQPEAGWEEKNGVVLFNKNFDTAESIHERIAELDTEAKYKSQGTFTHQGVVQKIKNESEELTQMLNKKVIHKLTIAAVNQDEYPYIKTKDYLYFNGFIDFFGYPLTYNNVEYLIIRHIFFQAFKSN